MATAGRPPVPIERKRQTGTLRTDRLPNGEPLALREPTEPVEPPEGLSTKGREFFSLVYDSGRWISQETDRTLVTLTAELIEEREQLRALVISNPEDYRLRSGLRELEKALTSNLSLLGFTPADRSRLGFAEIKKENKLDALFRKQAEHHARVLSQ